jgi:sulfate transport system ATP-binding protein
MSIELSGITKRFGSFVAVDNVDLHVETGELLALLGPSGSGKTSLLRIIAGLEAPDVGTVAFHGEDATDRHARERQVGFVFQHYALFGHLTIFENVAFGLRVRPRAQRQSEAAIRKKVMSLPRTGAARLASRTAIRISFPAASGNGSRLRARRRRATLCCCWTSVRGALDARVRQECAAGCGVSMTKCM